MPVDISRDHLVASAESINVDFPQLEVLPVCADFTRPFDTPEPSRKERRRVVYFPGSTIGNFLREAAVGLLEKMRREAGDGGCVLIGVDLKKDVGTLEAAYNDAKGVTAAFNLNLLHRINREMQGTFDVDAFRHAAVWVEERGAVEMRLVSERDQTVRVGDRTFPFRKGEWIHTEDSHKYALGEFAQMASTAGLTVERVWTDEKSLFSVQYLEA